MKRPGKELEKYWYAGLTGFFVIVAALVVYAITSNLTGLGKIFGALNSALMPVYIGVVIAYLLSPLVNKSDRYIFIPLWSKIFKGKKKKHQMLRGDVPCFLCFFWRYLLCLEL